jgi:hypothetical protein
VTHAHNDSFLVCVIQVLDSTLLSRVMSRWKSKAGDTDQAGDPLSLLAPHLRVLQKHEDDDRAPDLQIVKSRRQSPSSARRRVIELRRKSAQGNSCEHCAAFPRRESLVRAPFDAGRPARVTFNPGLACRAACCQSVRASTRAPGDRRGERVTRAVARCEQEGAGCRAGGSKSSRLKPCEARSATSS